MNRPCEQMLGYTLEDLAGRNIWELHTAWDNHHRQQQQQDPAKAPSSQGEHQKSSVDFRTSSADHHKSHIEYWQGEPKVSSCPVYLRLVQLYYVLCIFFCVDFFFCDAYFFQMHPLSGYYSILSSFILTSQSSLFLFPCSFVMGQAGIL